MNPVYDYSNVSENDNVAYRKHGDTSLLFKNYENAIKDFSRAICIDGNDNIAYRKRGETYRLLENYDKAIADFTTAIKISPKDGLAYRGIGDVFFDKGDIDSAIENYNHAIEILPRNHISYYLRGMAFHQKGDYDNAIRDFDYALEIKPDSVSSNRAVYSSRGLSYYMKEKYDRAISDWANAVTIAPNDGIEYFWSGLAYMAKGDITMAIVSYEKALRINPDNKDAQKLLEEARILQAEGEYDDNNEFEIPLEQLPVTELEDILAEALNNIFNDLIHEVVSDNDVPWPLITEKDKRRYVSQNLRLRLYGMSKEDTHYAECLSEYKSERERAVAYCQENYIEFDFPGLETKVDASPNKGIIYWCGENTSPELIFKSGSDISHELYLFKPMGNRVLFNKIQINNGQVAYFIINSESTKLLLLELLGREMYIS